MILRKWKLSHLHIANTALPAILLLLMTACSKPQRPALQTYSVTGQVVAASVKIPEGTRIEFHPKKDGGEYAAIAYLDAEGKFSLKIPYTDRVLPGAIAGTHTARLVKRGLNLGRGLGDDGSGLIPLPDEYDVKPAENYFKIILPKK